MGVFLGDAANKKAINIERIAGALPRHLLAHIVMGEKHFFMAHPTKTGTGWLAYIAKGLHLMNCFISLEYSHPRLALVQRGLEQRSCVLDLLLLAGAVWNTELAGASAFSHYVLCAEGIRLTSAALATALQQDLDRGADSSKSKNDSSSSSTHSKANTTTNGGIPYLYEWYDALIVHPKLNTFISLPIDTINLLQSVTFKALQSSPDHIPKLCRSFHTQLEAFYLMCCSEEFIGQLLLHPIFLEGELLRILQQSLDIRKHPWTSSSNNQALSASGTLPNANPANAFQQNEPLSSVLHQILRVLYLLDLITYVLNNTKYHVCINVVTPLTFKDMYYLKKRALAF